MLLEALLWLGTPCPASVRRLGLLHEVIALWARERRCRAAWWPHQQQSQSFLIDSALRAPGRDLAVVLGSGTLADVPVEALARRFHEVWLVDVVHLPMVRWRVRRWPGVRCLTLDVTGCLEGLARDEVPPAGAALEVLAAADWVASVNLWSQLALPACRAQAQVSPAWEAALRRAHLDALRRFPSGCLLADARQVTRNPDGSVLHEVDFGQELSCLGEPACQWEWPLAPPGELPGGRTSVHQVAAWQWFPRE